MNTNVKVIGLTRLGVKPESTAPEVDVVTTRPSELLNLCVLESFRGFVGMFAYRSLTLLQR